jgi:hypothetical protein
MIIVSDTAEDPYTPSNPDPHCDQLPHSRDIIDATFSYENGVPHFVFIHEWIQTVDGAMEFFQLSPVLSRTTTEPIVLLRASIALWVLKIASLGEKDDRFENSGLVDRWT